MKIVVIEPLGVEKEKLLEIAAGCLDAKAEIVYHDTRTTDTASLIERGRDADVIVVSNLPLGREVIEGCKSLKLISVAFTGVDHIAVDACRERGIMVCNSAGYSTAAVADLVFGFIIGLYRHIIACDQRTRSSQTKDGLIGYELEGKTFGIIGTGAIGLRVAQIAKAFGCQVYAYSRTPKEADGIIYTDLDELLRISDIVSLHVPLTEATKGLINGEKLSLMKRNAILINTARGPVVDSNDLATALNNGTIAGAGIDVFEIEPPISTEHPLLGAKNVIVTPHVAFASKEALIKRGKIVFENVRKWIDGMPQNVI